MSAKSSTSSCRDAQTNVCVWCISLGKHSGTRSMWVSEFGTQCLDSKFLTNRNGSWVTRKLPVVKCPPQQTRRMLCRGLTCRTQSVHQMTSIITGLPILWILLFILYFLLLIIITNEKDTHPWIHTLQIHCDKLLVILAVPLFFCSFCFSVGWVSSTLSTIESWIKTNFREEMHDV